ncbi:MAG: peptide-N4-asparagine amidase [Thermoplasmata archaeon]
MRMEHHALANSRVKRGLFPILSLFIAILVITSHFFQISFPSEENEFFPIQKESIYEANNVQYVNFTNPSWDWNTTFTDVPFPQGSFRRITVTLKLINHGDPWDRANVVAVNSIAILEITTKENASVLRNPVQIYTRNVTEYSNLFDSSAQVYWQAMPDYNGGWFAELSFAFYPGTPPIVLPEVVPAIFMKRIGLSGDNSTSVNVTFPENITSAKAVLYEEGFSDEEFWFAGTSPYVRDFTLDINTTRVFDITAYPFLNSGACLNWPECYTLYEWNGTPPLGTGIRPPHVIDISPFVSLLNGTQKVTLSIDNGKRYWTVNLAFLVWRNPRLSPYILDTYLFNRTASNTQQLLESSATAHRFVPNGIESIQVNHTSWLNSTFPTVTAHTTKIVSRTIASPSISILIEEKEEIFHNLTRDGSGAGDVQYIISQTNTSKSLGNGQNYLRIDRKSFMSFIDGSLGGRSSVDTRLWNRYTYGNYSNLGITWERESLLWQNRTSSMGVGQDEPPYLFESLSGIAHPFPAIFFVAPAYNSRIDDIETIFDFLFADSNIINATLSLDSKSYDITNNQSFSWNTTEAYGPSFVVNATAVNIINITSYNEIFLLGTKLFFSINFTSERIGWNFISIPLPLENKTIESVLSPIGGRYDAVYYYNAFDAIDPWKSYLTFKPYRDLSLIDSKMGFWIYITAPANLEIVGPLPNVTSIKLREGWNMVGFPSLAENYTVSDFMADTGATRVEGYADLPPYYLTELPSDYILRQGEGYWVYVPQTVDWLLPSW